MKKTQIMPTPSDSSSPNQSVRASKTKNGDQNWAESTAKNPSLAIIRNIKVQEPRSFSLGWLQPRLTAEDQAFANSLCEHDQSMIVRDTLQLMHLTEFLLLTEFTEIIVPLVYCTSA